MRKASTDFAFVYSFKQATIIMKQTMAGKSDKAAAAMKDAGQKAKAATAKLYVLARDPEMKAKAEKLFADGKKIYRAATSPEAKENYRKVAAVIDKMRTK